MCTAGQTKIWTLEQCTVWSGFLFELNGACHARTAPDGDGGLNPPYLTLSLKEGRVVAVVASSLCRR